jgi:hypothetical protein
MYSSYSSLHSHHNTTMMMMLTIDMIEMLPTDCSQYVCNRPYCVKESLNGTCTHRTSLYSHRKTIAITMMMMMMIMIVTTLMLPTLSIISTFVTLQCIEQGRNRKICLYSTHRYTQRNKNSIRIVILLVTSLGLISLYGYVSL